MQGLRSSYSACAGIVLSALGACTRYLPVVEDDTPVATMARRGSVTAQAGSGAKAVTAETPSGASAQPAAPAVEACQERIPAELVHLKVGAEDGELAWSGKQLFFTDKGKGDVGILMTVNPQTGQAETLPTPTLDRISALYATEDSVYLLTHVLLAYTTKLGVYNLKKGELRWITELGDQQPSTSILTVDANYVYIGGTNILGARVKLADGAVEVLDFRKDKPAVVMLEGSAWYMLHQESNGAAVGRYQVDLRAAAPMPVNLGAPLCTGGVSWRMSSTHVFCMELNGIFRLARNAVDNTARERIFQAPQTIGNLLDLSTFEGDYSYFGVEHVADDEARTLRRLNGRSGEVETISCNVGVVASPVITDKHVYWSDRRTGADDTTQHALYRVAKP